MKTPSRPRIILASSSPRRIELMRQVGFKIRVIKPEIDESVLPDEKPSHLVERLSLIKALSVAEANPHAKGPSLIVAADTIVVAPGGKRILNKPQSPAEARRMLALLLGREHEVLTGYHILSLEGTRLTGSHGRVVSTRVRMRKLDAQAIRRYVATGEPMDKAGAYAAQGIGMGMIQSLSGSYTNVVGLPMSQLLEDLERFFGVRGATG